MWQYTKHGVKEASFENFQLIEKFKSPVFEESTFSKDFQSVYKTTELIAPTIDM